MIAMRKNQAVGSGVYEPTLEEIRRACVAIQATWSPRERARRYRRPRAALWLTPAIQLSDLVEAMNAENQASKVLIIREG